MAKQAKIIDNYDQVLLVVNSEMTERLKQAGMMLRDEMKAQAPVLSGRLKRSVRYSVDAKQQVVRVIAGNKKAWYIHLVLFGTAAKRMLKGEGNKRKKVRSAGFMPPNNFMLRAYQNMMSPLMALFGKPMPEIKGDPHKYITVGDKVIQSLEDWDA